MEWNQDPHHTESPEDFGMVLCPEATMHVHTTDPHTARLVITWNGLESDGSAELEALDAVTPAELREMPRRVCLVLQGNVSLDGVKFDHVLKGGIKIPDPSIRRRHAATGGPRPLQGNL